MNITLQIINTLGLVFFSWLVWTFYQMYLAAWNRENAKEVWLAIFNTSLGMVMQPFFKWLILIVFAGSSFTLILLFINFLMKLTLAVMGSNVTTW